MASWRLGWGALLALVSVASLEEEPPREGPRWTLLETHERHSQPQPAIVRMGEAAVAACGVAGSPARDLSRRERLWLVAWDAGGEAARGAIQVGGYARRLVGRCGRTAPPRDGWACCAGHGHRGQAIRPMRPAAMVRSSQTLGVVVRGRALGHHRRLGGRGLASLNATRPRAGGGGLPSPSANVTTRLLPAPPAGTKTMARSAATPPTAHLGHGTLAAAKGAGSTGRNSPSSTSPGDWQAICQVPRKSGVAASLEQAASSPAYPVDKTVNVFWVVNPDPSEGVASLLRLSVQSVIASRAPGERLRLFVIVYKEPATATSATAAAMSARAKKHGGSRGNTTVGCNPFFMGVERHRPALQGHGRPWWRRRTRLVCTEREVRHVARSCALGDDQAPAPAEVALTILRPVGEWETHPKLVQLADYRRAFTYRTSGSRPDLALFAAQAWFRYVAYGALLPLGVRRAIYLDGDTLVQASLGPLFSTRLAGPHAFACAARCLRDPYRNTERIMFRLPFVAAWGFTHQSRQTANTGVVVMDLLRSCEGRVPVQLAKVARAAAKGDLWDRRSGTFDQPVAEIALARNISFVDPRWNCRGPVDLFPHCFVVHRKTKLSALLALEAEASARPVWGIVQRRPPANVAESLRHAWKAHRRARVA